jgi:hypothetical protein
VRAIELGGEALPAAAGRIWICPPATPDCPSLVSTTTACGSAGLTGSNATVGGVSSMWTVTLSVGELAAWPLTSSALFQLEHDTFHTPVPLSVIQPDGYA